MLTTENEMLSKWCYRDLGHNCCGSDCGGWRWGHDFRDKVDGGIQIGYCGPAGIPLELHDLITPIAGGLQAD